MGPLPLHQPAASPWDGAGGVEAHRALPGRVPAPQLTETHQVV